jgi:hypothetical protein
VTQKTHRAAFDPGYDPACPGPSAGSTPERILAPGASDAVYDHAPRPASVHRAVARVTLTGRIGKPLITLHGDLDALLPKAADSDVHAHMVDASGRGGLRRYRTVQGGTHVDGLYDTRPDRLRPVLPCYRSAFDALVAWVERGVRPPADRTVGRPASGDVVDSCALDGNPRRGGSASAAELPAGDAAQPTPLGGVQREVRGGRDPQDYQEGGPPGQPDQQDEPDRHSSRGDLRVLRHLSPPSRPLPLSVGRTAPHSRRFRTATLRHP